MKQILIGVFVLLSVSLCLGQTAQNQTMQPAAPASQPEHPGVMTPDNIKWTSSFLPGVQIAVLSGNPDANGPFAIRLKMADGNQVAPHWHPTDENVTVISGNFMVGMGDKFEPASMQTLPVGSHVFVPKEMRHYAKANGETIIEIYGEGPFQINYVNPADDPRNAKKQ